MPTIDLKDAAKFIAGIKMKQAGIRGLRSAALRGVNEILTFIIPSRTPEPRDRGIYRSGWRSVELPLGATVQNDEPHAVFIEEGVRNVRVLGKAQGPLAAWAIRKGIATAENARSVAFAIGVNMKKRGNIFGPGGMGVLRELVEGKLADFVKEEIEREIKREVGG